jgi:DNA-binding response OmpR family regulator
MVRLVDILVVGDDRHLTLDVARALSAVGHGVEVARDGATGLRRAERGDHDVIILDVLLPVLDELQVSRALRRQRARAAILLLSTGDAVPDHVRGLDAGADDYLVKPFAMAELLARVRALGRRVAADDSETLRVGDLTLDLATHEAWRGDTPIALTAREFALLRYLMRHQRRVLTKAQITDHVWGYDAGTTSNVAEIYIHYLRNKIDRGHPRPLIRTVRGVGYTIKE